MNHVSSSPISLLILLQITLFFTLASFYPPQGGSIRGFFLSVISSNTVNTGQLRSITVNGAKLKSIKISRSVGPLVRRSVGPSVRPSVGHTYVIFANFGLIKLS